MSKAFKLLIFATFMVFVYVGSVSPVAHNEAENLRWGMLGLLSLFALAAPARRPGAFTGRGLKFFAAAFAALALGSSAYSFLRPYYTFLRGVSVCFLVVFVFYSLWPRLRRLADYVSLMNLMVLLAWIIAGGSVVVFVFWRGLAVRWTGAVQGVFGNPNMLGMVLAVLIPVTIARVFYKKSVWTAGLVVVMFVLLYLSQSRAGLLGTLCGSGIFVGGYYGKKLWIIVLVLFAVASPYIVLQQSGDIVEEVQESVLRGETEFNDLGSGRVGLWRKAYARAKTRPFTGFGFGTAGDYYMSDGRPFRWHSSFIQIMLELGALGLFFFFAPIAYSAVKAVRGHFGSEGDRAGRAVIAGFVGAWFAGAVDSCFESWLFSVGNPTCLLTWICFAAAMKGLSEWQILRGAEDDHAQEV